MKWSDLSVGKQIGAGFGVVLFFLIIIGILSFSGVGGIVKNASEVIEGKALDSSLAQKEVDHLNWAGSVNRLITDETVHSLDVETDYTQCAFGKWLYGDGRKSAETLVPELIPIFKQIEAPHRRLHESALKIEKVYTKSDPGLPEFIARKEIDHLNWSATIQKAILENRDEIIVETNHTKCSFGRWLYGEEAKKSTQLDPELARLLDAIKSPHQAIHETAVKLISIYKKTNPGLIEGVREQMDNHRKWISKISDDILEFQPELSVKTDGESCGFPEWENREATKVFFESSPEMKQVFSEIKNRHKRIHEIAQNIDAALKEGAFNKAEELLKTDIRDAVDNLENGFEKAIAHETKLEFAQLETKKIFENELTPQLKSTRGILQKIAQRADELLDGYISAAGIYAKETAPSLHQVQTLLGELRQVAKNKILTDQAMLDAAKGTKIKVAVISLIALVTGMFLAFLIARQIISALTGITSNLDEGADQVASASDEISASSQSLAQGASDQAASIEETSSALEEMATMTKQNAENASHADTLGRETGDAVADSMVSMSELTRSMDDISKASEETSHIIKTIDEIAFQTNLLALNAAVEAARAGEAGAGFAVVADEVRNLAMRAADAASNTSELIEITSAKVAQGTKIVEKTSAAFNQVEQNTGKIAGLVGEIAASSKEQAEGIEQINLAVAEMDKVTQRNAANAEESASASEEMNAQAEQMKSIVKKMMEIVGMSSGSKQIEHKPQQPKGLIRKAAALLENKALSAKN